MDLLPIRLSITHFWGPLNAELKKNNGNRKLSRQDTSRLPDNGTQRKD